MARMLFIMAFKFADSYNTDSEWQRAFWVFKGSLKDFDRKNHT